MSEKDYCQAFWHFPLIEVDSLSENLGPVVTTGWAGACSSATQKFFPLNRTMTWPLIGRTDLILSSSMSFRIVSGRFRLRYGLVKEGEQAIK